MVKKFLGILNIGLITVSVFFGVKLFYGSVTTFLEGAIISAELKTTSTGNNSPKALNRQDISSERSFSEYEAIANRDLFKTKTVEDNASGIMEANIEALEKTRLELKLWGTITGDTGGTAYAVIEDLSKRQQSQHLFREGDRIGDADIKLILREKVVLRVDGEDEILEMEQLLDESMGLSGSMQGRKAAKAAYGRSDADQEIRINRDAINDALSDVGNLMRQVRIRPYFEDGNPEGVLLSGIRRGSIFEDMGLKSGDVVVGVNGEPIKSVEDAMKLYDGMKSAQNVAVQIERNGTPQTISYRID